MALALITISAAAFNLVAGTAGTAARAGQYSPSPEAISALRTIDTARPSASTADHSKFEILQQDFKDGPSVTAACLTCHTEAASQVMKTSHWTWICPTARQELEERQGIEVGKAEHVINNFCIALGSNEARCTSCHIGYGWRDKTFDFSNQTLVDCLVCHDTTRTYKKFPTDAGHPVYASTHPDGRPFGGQVWEPVDLRQVAVNVGKPSRYSCGTCHFFGGGGEGVKHGDMDVTLDNPSRDLDIHMSPEGAGFNCTVCHTTRDHRIAGRCFTIPPLRETDFSRRGLESNLLACQSCHTPEPHPNAKLNDHLARVACQTCHVPTMARQKATKMWWDWKTTGRMNDQGKPMTESEEVKGEEVVTYDTRKGSFIWAKDEWPEYVWFDGRVSHTFIGDRIDDQTPGHEQGRRSGAFDRIDVNQPIVPINTMHGQVGDRDAKIWPVKIHRGRQPYDTELKTLVVPKLFGPPGSGAYWSDFNWQVSIQTGMDYIEQPYSGEMDFIQTEMIWPLSHMIAPKEYAVSCVECHQPEQGRLAALTGFYMPGRDRSVWLDRLGLLLIGGAITGSLAHGAARVIISRRKPGNRP